MDGTLLLNLRAASQVAPVEADDFEITTFIGITGASALGTFSTMTRNSGRATACGENDSLPKHALVKAPREVIFVESPLHNEVRPRSMNSLNGQMPFGANLPLTSKSEGPISSHWAGVLQGKPEAPCSWFDWT